MERRDKTSIKIQILKILYMNGQAGVYSGQLGGLVHELCTNYYTFSKALRELEHQGLVVCEYITLGTGKLKVARITEEGRKMLSASLPLLAKIS
jgi:predicted transcriptional regulator